MTIFILVHILVIMITMNYDRIVRSIGALSGAGGAAAPMPSALPPSCPQVSRCQRQTGMPCFCPLPMPLALSHAAATQQRSWRRP